MTRIINRVFFPSFESIVPGTSSSAHDKIGTTKDGMSRTASGSDINEKNYSIFFPIDRLAKVCVVEPINRPIRPHVNN